MGNRATVSNESVLSTDDGPLSETQIPDQIFIGWYLPSHLFTETAEGSLCGQSGWRDSISIANLEDYTSPLSYPLRHLSSKEEIIRFANGLCQNCLHAYYSTYSSYSLTNYLDNYKEKIIENREDRKLGFCYICGHPVDSDQCGTAEVGDKYPIYVCDECSLRTYTNLTEAFGRTRSDEDDISKLAERFRTQLSEVEEKDL